MNNDNDYGGGGGNNNVNVFAVRLLKNVYLILSSLLTVASVRIATKVIKAKDAVVTVMGGTVHVIGI